MPASPSTFSTLTGEPTCGQFPQLGEWLSASTWDRERREHLRPWLLMRSLEGMASSVLPAPFWPSISSLRTPSAPASRLSGTANPSPPGRRSLHPSFSAAILCFRPSGLCLPSGGFYPR
jgi:hypothetical protein